MIPEGTTHAHSIFSAHTQQIKNIHTSRYKHSQRYTHTLNRTFMQTPVHSNAQQWVGLSLFFGNAIRT